MKVVLTKNIETLGNRGDIKDVSRGYAQNYLIPNGLAEVLTPGVRNNYKMLAKKIDQEKAKAEAGKKDLQASLKDVKIDMEEKVNEDDKLFGAITAKEIIKYLKSNNNIEVTEKNIKKFAAIKKIGSYKITFIIDKDKEIKVPLVVKAK
ncbi:MAG: 50S ribosomal protein L9 [bacterium]